MKKKLFVLCTICFMFLFSGCELFDVLEDAINNVWGAPSKVDVLVLPPYPFLDGKENTEWTRALAGVYSENVKSALLRGIDAFNDGSKRTQVVPNYFTKKDIVTSFYKEFFNAAKSSEDADKKLRQCLKELLDILNKPEEDGTRHNFKCAICGMYEYKRSNTANVMNLLYFDKDKYTLTMQAGTVIKEEGFDQDNDLQQLMTALLKKAYGK